MPNDSAVLVKVFLATEAATESTKTTVLNVKAIQRINETDTYVFPCELQNITNHPHLIAVSSIKNAKDSMKKRHMRKSCRATLSGDALSEYCDPDGNFWFKKEYLEEGTIQYVSEAEYDEENATETVIVKRRSLHHIEKEIVLEKFNGNNYNATTWIELFEQECDRVDAETDQYMDVLRLLLEGHPQVWYAVTKKTIGTGSWATWKKEFKVAFGSKGWNEVSDAYKYKYIGGSLIEYAFKKHNLLLDADPGLPELSRVNMIVVGLPNFAQSRISRASIDTIKKLTVELNQLESGRSNYKKPWDKKPSGAPGVNDRKGKDDRNSPRRYEPCRFCKNIGKEGMRHAEKFCWNNPTGVNYMKRGESENRKTGPVKIANNMQLERQMNEEFELKN